MKILENLKKANAVLKSEGGAAIFRKIAWYFRNRREEKKYQKWIEREKVTDEKRQNFKNEIVSFSHKPLISIILPVYDIEEKWLRLCVGSVLNQVYENWELCIADDKSPRPHVRKILQEYAAKDERIKMIFRAENGHISAASNSALEIATGEFCVLLDHDDELSADALYYVVKELNDFPETVFIYSDEDLIDANGRRFSPKFKPDFSRDLMYSLNLITHLSAYKTEILRKIGGFRVGFEGSQDYDLALRVLEEIDEKQIRHITRVLYHWRVIEGSVSFSADAKPYAHDRARKAIQEHLERLEKRAKLSETLYYLHRVHYNLPENLPKVSLILSGSTDFEKSRRIFAEKTDYRNLEIIENKTENAEHLNKAVLQSKGEILCFVSANFCPLATDWLTELTSFAIQKEISAVGAKLLVNSETVLTNGLIIGTKEVVSFAHRNFPREASGNMCRNRLISNFSAVSILCLAVQRELFDEVGGFDVENLPNALFDADFCLKLREKNLRILVTPYAELKQIGKANLQMKTDKRESDFFKQKWRSVIEKDPFYNPNLSLKGETFSIKF